MGEGPNFWTLFKLSFNIHKLSEEKLVEVLSLRRLATLQNINLSGWGFIYWQLPQHLKIISDCHPLIRSLSIGPQMILKFCNKEEAAKLAEALIKFEEVECSCLCKDETLLLGALTSASNRADSKLKVISFQARSSKFNSEALAEARRRFAVNLLEDPDRDSDHFANPDPDYYDDISEILNPSPIDL